MRRWCLGVAFLAGCYRPATEAPCVVTCNYNAERACPGDLECMGDNLCHAPGGGCGPTDDVMRIDAPTDGAPVDNPPGSVCFGRGTGTGPGLLRICHPSSPALGALTLAPLINTDSNQLCEPVSQGPALPGLCVLYAENISFTGRVRAEGSRALVLVASQGIVVDGTFDVGRVTKGVNAAPGADSAVCIQPQAPTGSNGGAGGGAGGTAQGSGGNGGNAGFNTAGRASMPQPLNGVRGGCSGGEGLLDTAPCSAGSGGGAVYLIAGNGITFTANGRIDASGGGATSGDGSGCGGGSGGLIGIDTPSISVNSGASLMARGGDGSPGSNNGGVAGNGAFGTTLTGSPGGDAANNLLAGGGGGGAGWIVVYGGGSLAGGDTSPPPTSP